MNKPNKAYVIVLAIMIIFNASNVFAQASKNTNIKVMTYNIWNGFDWGKDTVRNENWVKWINEQNPDVLALQELCGYNEEKLKAEAVKWGHPYVKILKSDGYPVGLTSKKPIILKECVIDGLWHGMLHCETYGIDFFIVHLSPADCDFRLKEASIIAEKVKQCNNEQYIILGDFNAHSPFDENLLKHNSSLLKKYNNKEADSKHNNLRLGEFDYSVISSFISIPAIDVCQKFIEIKERYTYPAPVLIGIWQTEEAVNQNKERIDYIFTSPSLSKSCTNATIYNGKNTGTLSDHYPLIIELSF